MDNDVLKLLEDRYQGFSKRQKKIADYIRDNYDKAAFMTAGKLADEIGISESTVVRFAADLGFEGYPEMKRALQNDVRSRLTSVQRIEAARYLTDDRQILKRVTAADIDRISAIVSANDNDNFTRAVDEVIGAKNIYIIGLRTSISLATFFGYYLNLLREGVHTVRDTAANQIFEQLIRLGEGDLLIAMSFPRYSRQTAEAMKYAKSVGAKTLAITNDENSPLCEYGDISLFAKSDMVSILDSLAAPMSLINALIVATAGRLQESALEMFNKLEGIWSELDVYE
ncbi:MAG: MurR/RpiR family transcriptional regulator [Oscillospiraceae bacterium]|jgi:DNA-binding MurR/RpiR family transcriptional regulator|nr:MurR/RpiR family transcriptional regulator [Oscillospiraceae bacterium]MBQ2145500.1 MurR/RpiR family transcriptional regulator [Oscillospiraceae bacterium]MBQ5490310.1 MurR/RpiR family transcriptional regulator [Oscillospiraceae bacterium]